MSACRTLFEWVLKVLNVLLILAGLSMVGYGIYLFVEYKTASSIVDDPTDASSGAELVQLGRPMLLVVSLGDTILVKLPKAWFIFLFTGIGIILVVVACFGCIGTAARNGCCLITYSVLLILLILVELGVAAFMFFDKSWKEDIPDDRTGTVDKIYQFVNKHWYITGWVALGFVILEVLVFVLALIVRAANIASQNDSDDEYSGGAGQQIRQRLVTGVPVAGDHDQRSGRNDAWSTRVRDKYGLDTSEPSESNKNQEAATQPSERKDRCIIM